jgi:predicted SprT family Zn-dependent metalloprotease
MTELRELTALANERFAGYLRALGGDAPAHRLEFSRRITTSWALIYYRRHLVRLSPYLFLLEPHELKHGTHWRELDATLRHEAAHAAHFARTGQTGHDPGFHRLLAQLGVRANGGCDLGPENTAFRYIYACPACDVTWPRRQALRGNWSCGHCAPGRFDPAFRLVVESVVDPWARLAARSDWVGVALAEARGPPTQQPIFVDALASALVVR